MAMIKVDMICPCGKLYTTKTTGTTNTSSGSFTCRKCKKRVEWSIHHGKLTAMYK